jgi:uncharacterized protein DUF2877
LPEVTAVAVAAPVAGLAARGHRVGVLVGTGTKSAHVDVDGFVVSIFASLSPPLPNSVALVPSTQWPSVGQRVRLGTSGEDEDFAIAWPAEAIWPTHLPVTDALAESGRALLTASGVAARANPALLAASFADAGLATAQLSSGLAGIERLLTAVQRRDPTTAADAADLLLGLGPGLTPEGDDLVAASAAILVSAGARAVARALVPPCARARTTALSATLLELAGDGHVPADLKAVFDPEVPSAVRLEHARALARLGASTGRAYALAAGASAFLLGE